jgi:hypothetical protein
MIVVFCEQKADREFVEKYKNCQEIMKTTYKKKDKNVMLPFWYKKTLRGDK